jgi:hypothetical protein
VRQVCTIGKQGLYHELLPAPGLIGRECLELSVHRGAGFGVNVEHGGVEPGRTTENLRLRKIVGELEQVLEREVDGAEVAVAGIVVNVVVTVRGGVVLVDRDYFECIGCSRQTCLSAGGRDGEGQRRSGEEETRAEVHGQSSI